jgi:hypothetical protein
VKLCLDCRRAWPADALICGTCRRSFGGRLCQRNHLSPAGSTCCTTCGSRQLLRPARYLNLRLPALILSWIVGLILLKLVFANIGAFLGLVFAALGAALSFVLGQSVGLALGAQLQYVVVLALLWLAFRKILGARSLPIRGVEILVEGACRALPRVARLGWIALLRAISGAHEPQRPPMRGGRD